MESLSPEVVFRDAVPDKMYTRCTLPPGCRIRGQVIPYAPGEFAVRPVNGRGDFVVR